MIAFQDLADWLAVEVDADYWPGLEIPDGSPIVMLTESPGPGMVVEGAMDVIAWQVRCAGAQGDSDRDSYAESQTLAHALDARIVRAAWPQMIGTTRVMNAQRLGSAPRALMRDEGDLIHFAAMYLFTVPTGY